MIKLNSNHVLQSIHLDYVISHKIRYMLYYNGMNSITTFPSSDILDSLDSLSIEIIAFLIKNKISPTRGYKDYFGTTEL